MSNLTTIDGITYDAKPCGLSNIHTNEPMYTLTKIGKRGRPVKQYRPALLRADGTWKLGQWIQG